MMAGHLLQPGPTESRYYQHTMLTASRQESSAATCRHCIQGAKVASGGLRADVLVQALTSATEKCLGNKRKTTTGAFIKEAALQDPGCTLHIGPWARSGGAHEALLHQPGEASTAASHAECPGGLLWGFGFKLSSIMAPPFGIRLMI